MSEASAKGKKLERDIASILRSKLGVKVSRDKRSGAGLNKSDINDYFGELPIFIEAKNQKTIKIKEFFKQALEGASVGQAATVVFKMDEEVLACLRFSDLVNLIAEIKDYKEEIAMLRLPIVTHVVDRSELVGVGLDGISYVEKESHNEKTCREGHIADQYGYCQQLTCRFSRGYRKPKVKK